jgi:hypothetical protein
MATPMTSGVAPVRAISESHNCSIPGPPCATARSPQNSPWASIRQTWWLWLAQSMPTNHAIYPPCSGPPLGSLPSGPPQRVSIPVLALEAQPPTGLPSRPTCRGAGPLEVLKTQDSRATPGRPARSGQSTIPTSQQPLLKGTGITGSRNSKPHIGRHRRQWRHSSVTRRRRRRRRASASWR